MDEATPVDLSVLVTLHNETLVAGPMMRSLECAITQVETRGLRVERLLGLDRPSDACLDYVEQEAFSRWHQFRVAFGDQGRTRNHLVQRARGRWIALMDGDDMCSENWLVEALNILRDPAATRTIVHPEINWVFDAGSYVYTNPPSSSRLFSERIMTTSNYFDALCVAPRAAWVETPFADRDLSKGFAFEDYQWAVEVTAKGWQHATAMDTIIFKRRRDTSQSTKARNKGVLIREVEAHAIDRVGGIAPR